ncbi:MAG: hypothetical protein AMXMBFR53_41580 [Gemmatimonadota bacterium]
MSAAVRFLPCLAQAVAGVSLYQIGHPAREGAIDRAYGLLLDLQREVPTPKITFLGDSVLLGEWPLRELSRWYWSSRMAAVGLQRIEFVGPVTRGDFEAFVEEIHLRFLDEAPRSAEVRQGRPSNIRYGEVRMRGETDAGAGGAEPVPVAKLGYSLREEIEAVRWLHSEVADERDLHLLEASAVVRSLSLAMHSDQSYVMPLIRLKEYDQYTTTHALNVSVLTMALAEFLGMGPREVRGFGIAGLLHDLGKVKIPKDILNKPGALSPEEREVMNGHTVEGARLILESAEHLDVAAVVAYEHHTRIDGGGYPAMHFKRPCHPASALVHVCDVFDALRTDRPYRDSLPTQEALGIIGRGAGTDFDADVARAFVRMMERFEKRIADVDPAEPEALARAPTEEIVLDADDPDDDGMTWVEV